LMQENQPRINTEVHGFVEKRLILQCNLCLSVLICGFIWFP